MAESDIVEIFLNAKSWSGSPPSDRDLADLPRNDHGNGRRLMARRGHDMLWVQESGWHIWTGRHWERDPESGGAIQIAFEVAEAILDEAKALQADACEIAGMTIDELRAAKSKNVPKEAAELLDRADKHAGFAILSGNVAKAEAMLRAAAAFLSQPPTALDANPLLLNVENGTIDLSGDQIELRPHSRVDLITKLAPVEYDPNAQCPEFRSFLAEIMPSREVAKFLQIFFGYCITGFTDEQVMAVLWGTGANGKSTLLNIIAGTVGNLAVHAPVESFLFQDRKAGADASPDLARLPGSRLVLTSEPETGARLSESRVKAVTGGEKLTVRRLRQDFFEFDPVFKLIFSCNIKPTIRGQDHGIWRRVLMIPFTVQIPLERRRKRLDAHILDKERPGVLNFLLDGFLLWREKGLIPPQEVTASTEEYRRESDPIGEFARWALKPGTGTIGATRLYDLYTAWCASAAVDPVKQAFFGRRIGDLGYHKERAGTVYYSDVELTDDAEQFEREKDRPHNDPPPAASPDDYGV